MQILTDYLSFQGGQADPAAVAAASALVGRLVRVAELAGGAEAAAAPSVAVAAAAVLAAVGPPVVGMSDADAPGDAAVAAAGAAAQELRVDPADGRAYDYASFEYVYGGMAEQHWLVAAPVGGSGAAVDDAEAEMDET